MARLELPLVATLLIVSGMSAESASARPASGVLFGDTLVAPEGDRYSEMLWVNCTDATDVIAQLKCELGDPRDLRDRINQPPRCFSGDVEPAPVGGFLGRTEETVLVKRTDLIEPLVDQEGHRNCRLANELVYLGLHSWEFEHSGFVPSEGESWWLDTLTVPLERLEGDAIQVGSTHFVCLEVRGVAMPEREYGYGHMGAYNRLLFVTETLRTFAPDRQVIESDIRHADQRACDLQ